MQAHGRSAIDDVLSDLDVPSDAFDDAVEGSFSKGGRELSAQLGELLGEGSTLGGLGAASVESNLSSYSGIAAADELELEGVLNVLEKWSQQPNPGSWK